MLSTFFQTIGDKIERKIIERIQMFEEQTNVIIIRGSGILGRRVRLPKRNSKLKDGFIFPEYFSERLTFREKFVLIMA